MQDSLLKQCRECSENKKYQLLTLTFNKHKIKKDDLKLQAQRKKKTT